MATYCKNSGKGCGASTMGEFENGICDVCYIAETHASQVFTELIDMREGEPMDGDETEELAKIFLAELNYLNGNK